MVGTSYLYLISRYVRVQDDKKRIKTESGVYISATYKTNRYSKWKERSKLAQQQEQQQDDDQDQVRLTPSNIFRSHTQHNYFFTNIFRVYTQIFLGVILKYFYTNIFFRMVVDRERGQALRCPPATPP